LTLGTALRGCNAALRQQGWHGPNQRQALLAQTHAMREAAQRKLSRYQKP
jgi:hypothetical protein